MLTPEENEVLTRIGPGTRMGALQRRYWHPIAAVAEMGDPSSGSGRTKRVRLLGEDLVLFKDRSGRFGLIAEACPHRRASFAYGIPTEQGIRCPYHGWMFDGSGRCLEQPNEPEGSNFKDKVTTAGYQVGELGGLLWAYLGPLPAPLIPRLDGFVAEGTVRLFGRALIPCNWVQIMENSVDAVHTEWLHGKLYEFIREKENVRVAIAKHHLKIGFDEAPIGIIKRRVVVGNDETHDDWKVGHPLIFPNILGIGNAGVNWYEHRFQIRVPVDDTQTMHYWYHAYVPPAGITPPAHLLDRVHTYDVPFVDEQGEFILDAIHAQDIMAWVTQGPIADRSQEALGVTDRGITMYRRMLMRELAEVEAGRDPKMTIRDPAENDVIHVPLEGKKSHRADGFENLLRRHQARYSPVVDDLVALYSHPEALPVLDKV
jgi:5,5'-dehydrodivanillate O-demethylase oxygenase subunit